ncbi:MAG: PAS domain S-box protein [Pseudodesulfovibrio sp.]|uniref:Diguanylate cyclase n=1 Tax=Pseudodesulfovibrio aespoeensis (strain ATCC 700646 / DSM 10631 / Aspo-2) TaxID=643562 RepID=E6VWZ2_PSEA9|nr:MULTISPECIES: PAS domain S-box protein [Pseudodesulfovibrio]MBU4191815.1 PAS domain S-box protein [Pseudomonadota bacterium]ADU61398.1 diguanylate cyclase [Pseudodesulfovibrio aespoeensis Aspo-2]MBU4245060.1 PAS domain S-box protein [Pseudomonadota bacterium]MBU4377524.1 PAS domain S-box protein [Pseudomonadota bacterium]MBU4474791.1 PAS domain S-box protein [Pseudomonadota bacterium]
MEQITRFFTSHEDWLMQRILDHAKRQGYTAYTSTLLEAWRISVAGLTEALVRAVERHGLDGPEFTPDDTFRDDPASAFAVEQSRKHRARGITLAMFLGLFKYYRRAYLALIDEKAQGAIDPEWISPCRAFTELFFDRVAIALSVDWVEAGDEAEHLAELQTRNRDLTTEKNMFLTLFESLDTPVFLLDHDLNASIMNLAAARLIGLAQEPGQVYYGQARAHGTPDFVGTGISLRDRLPWLASELGRLCPLEPGQRACRFDASGETADGMRHFSVAVSHMDDVSGKFSHSIVSLEDITGRMDMERQLAREHERATHYLDIVGSIVVALDTAGRISLINRAGCTTLGYKESELLGQDWIDLIIPDEQRDESRDYLYCMFSGDADTDAEHTNYVTTRSGDHRLITWKNQLLTDESGAPAGVLSSGTDITEQRAAEQALSQKELWLRNTFVALGEAVFILTPDARILDANPAARAMFQMTDEELAGASVELLHASHENFLEFEQRKKAAFEAGVQANFEFTMRRKDGDIFPTEHSVSRITCDDGTLLGTVSVVRDISSRKWAEQKLRQSEEKFRRIFETIEDGYIVTDMNGVIQMVNPATCAHLGYAESELVGQSMASLYADDNERARFVMALDATGAARGHQLTAKHKDGSRITVEASAHLVRDETGRAVAKEGTFRDITQRIEADRLLREREKQYRALFENNHSIMLLMDPRTGRIVDANPAAVHFYGYPADTLRSMPFSDINAQDETAIFKEMVDSRREKRSYFIHRHRLADGDIRDVEVYSGPIMVQGNQLLYSVIHDITERVRLEREMKRLATTDSLTGAANRHEFFRLAELELRRAMRYGHSLAVLMLDIDYFKSINDTHGHQTGDAVLKALSALVRTTLRDTDIFGRLGGEEFAAVLPETDLAGGVLVADRLRRELGALKVRLRDIEVMFTVSIGLTETRKSERLIDDAINRADEAMYKAKRMGRNRVESN